MERLAPDDAQAVHEGAAAPDFVAAQPTPAAAVLAPAESRTDEHALDPRSVTVARIVGFSWIAAGLLNVIVALIVSWFFGDRMPGWILAAVAGGAAALLGGASWFAYKWPDVHHAHVRYRVDDTGMTIRKGVFWRKVLSVPRSRVQHTDVTQGPLQRRYEVGTLTIHTAGTQDASISISGLEHATAMRLRDHLLGGGDDDAV